MSHNMEISSILIIANSFNAFRTEISYKASQNHFRAFQTFYSKLEPFTLPALGENRFIQCIQFYLLLYVTDVKDL